MPVNLPVPQAHELFPVAGLRLGVAQAGIRKVNRTDLCLILADEGTAVGAVFTRNRFCAAPVQVCRQHLAQGRGIRALVINTGCANAGTGESGLAHARYSCEALAAHLGIAPEQVLPFSTGVIMEPLPVQRLVAALPAALADARADRWLEAAQAIMTTDTQPKAVSRQVVLASGHTVTVTGMAKGAGMIRPNMATMLGFIATDAVLSPALAQELAAWLAERSFNRVTVDGDTSTNDSFVLLATGKAGHPMFSRLEAAEVQPLRAALLEVAQHLAHALVRDGEGASKFITVQVCGGRDGQECLQAAYAVAHSPLVKTAFFASDPNLGRILAAVGYAGIADLDPALIEMHLDDVHVVTRGGRHPAYQEADGARVMAQPEITIRIDLGRGTASETVWTCDLSTDYVRINADYRS